MNQTESWRQTSRSAGEEGRPGGPPPRGDPPQDDARLVEALREYQAQVDAGRRPSRRDFLARHPDVADELAECLDGLQFLHSTAPRLRPAETPAPLPPDSTLGDFQLVREIGKGGMGVVYEALQLSLGRRVALKVLPLAATLDGRQMQRFENEARAAAHLHHGNIVPVFAVGCERGVPYYAMQLIEGRTLAAIIEDLRQTPHPAPAGADTAIAALTQQSVVSRAFFRTVAALGVQAADALEYAHQMGVVHRDVKPANLILDARGHLWVTDFGLARFSASPGLTVPGDLVGTLRYMSPEQAAGQPVIDPRSDVYSLGATLYELLTQQPAFPAQDRRECLRQIGEQEPVPPRKLNRAVPAELEIIVLKAMAKDPHERYGSAKELADDLRRWLDDRPVLARRPGLRQQVTKWARRHRWVVAAGLLALVGAVLALSATTWRIALAEAETLAAYEALKNEKEELKREEERTKTALNRAEGNYRQARKVLDFLTNLGANELAEKPKLQGMRRRLLTELLAYYQEFIDQHGDDPTITAELVEARLQVAQLLDEMGKKAESLAHFERAMGDRARLPGGPRSPFPSIGPPRGLARSYLMPQPAVQKDLKLSEEQVKQVSALQGFRGHQRNAEELAAAEKALEGLLTPPQAARFQQIVRQAAGLRGLLDREVARTLDLTEDQKESIRGLLAKFQRPGPGRGRRGRGGRPPETGERSGSRPVREQVLAVLTPQQRERWQAMLGEPFRGELRPRGKRGPGG